MEKTIEELLVELEPCKDADSITNILDTIEKKLSEKGISREYQESIVIKLKEISERNPYFVIESVEYDPE